MSTVSPPFTFTVSGGSRSLDVHKGFRGVGRLVQETIGSDRTVRLETASRLGNGRRLYLSGNRVNIPEINPSTVLHLHDGNPLHRITILVMKGTE